MTAHHGTTPQTAEERDRHDAHAKPLALVLWVLVLAALAYGVSQTLAKVVALFS